MVGETESRAKLLLVDDDEIVRRAGKRYLERKLPVDVVTAKDAYEALGLLDSGERFHVAVLDLDMPGMKGTALLDEIAAFKPRLRCVLWTGSASAVSAPHAAAIVTKKSPEELLLALTSIVKDAMIAELRQSGMRAKQGDAAEPAVRRRTSEET